MHEMYSDRALTNCRCHALHISRPTVSNREDARHTRLQHVRSPCQWPQSIRGASVQVGAGQHEPLLIESNAVLQPFRSRRRSGHHEYIANWTAAYSPGLSVAPLDRFKMGVPMQPDDFSLIVDVDLRILLDTINQIL